MGQSPNSSHGRVPEQSTGDSVGLVRVDDLARAYDFGASHPLRPERVLLTYDLIESLGLAASPNVTMLPGRVASRDEILAVHARDYVEIVEGVDEGRVDAGTAFDYGLGTPDNPIFHGMHAASSAVCGASVTAAEAVVSGRSLHAFNPAGGLHHARRREASGFCIYNDPAAAIALVRKLRPEWRVMYVDVDVHHGDGVQWIFYDDPDVLTLSLHQSGRYLYPGTGFTDETGGPRAPGTAANVPLPPYVGETDYLWALERVLAELAGVFRPDVLVAQLGADTHHGDPLANLALTMRAYPVIARLLHETAHEWCEGRWIATGGGGYQAETVVPKVWTIHFAEMVGAPEAVPPEWLEDLPETRVAGSHRSEVERTVDDVLARCVGSLSSR